MVNVHSTVKILYNKKVHDTFISSTRNGQMLRDVRFQEKWRRIKARVGDAGYGCDGKVSTPDLTRKTFHKKIEEKNQIERHIWPLSAGTAVFEANVLQPWK